MGRRHSRAPVATLFATLLFGLIGAPAQAETITLKYGWMGPATEPTYVKSMAPFGAAVAADSQGTVKVDMYPGGTLGRDPSAQIKYLQDGVLDIAYVIPSYTPARFPDNAVIELPGLYRSATEATLVMWRLFEKGMLRGYEDVEVIQLATTYPNLIHTAKPLSKLSDLKGMKLRVSGPTAGDAVRALGAVPVGMPINQGAEAITRGVVDGTVSDWNTYAAFRLNDAAKNHLNVHLGQSPMLVAMTKKRYEALPEPAKLAIKKHGYEKLSREVGELHDSITQSWRERVKTERGHTLVDLDDAQQKEFEAKMAPLIDAWAEKHDRGRELLDAVRAELASIRSGK